MMDYETFKQQIVLNLTSNPEVMKELFRIDAEQAKVILEQSKQREDNWWALYRKGLVKYDKDTVAI